MDTVPAKRRVAVVGTGMAGLVAAFLLSRDPQHKYEVTTFEKGPEASLDAASVSVHDATSQQQQRVDVPMRAFSEGYYPNLKDMYDFLGVQYKSQRMLFSFEYLDAARPVTKVSGELQNTKSSSTYFIHASNSHIFPPPRPLNMPFQTYLLHTLLAGACFFWFWFCCRFVKARRSENLAHYFRRIWLPPDFVRLFILPLLSAICTCSHQDLLLFPAQDVVEYRKRIAGGKQFVVLQGVKDVQDRLIENLKIEFRATVEAVESHGTGSSVVWQKAAADGTYQTYTTLFDVVVLAVPPNVVSKLFRPAREQLSRIPCLPIRTLVHPRVTTPSRNDIRDMKSQFRALQRTATKGEAQVIRLKTTTGGNGFTEATHVHGSGTMVSSLVHDINDRPRTSAVHVFTRVLRTVESRLLTNRVFDDRSSIARDPRKWKNGDGGVWLTGAWCWDGMVLLEGCLVSAMRVAHSLGVEVPWLRRRN